MQNRHQFVKPEFDSITRSGTEKEVWMSESCAGLGTGLLATRSAVARAHVGNTIVRGIEASESNPALMHWLRQLFLYADSDVDDHSSMPFIGCHEMDLWIGGFPCQPWSASGALGQEDDPRHISCTSLERIISIFRPKIFVLENVEGYKQFWLDKLVPILHAAGYSTHDTIIDAREWVPQSRNRFYMVAIDSRAWPNVEVASLLPVEPASVPTKTLQSIVKRRWPWET